MLIVVESNACLAMEMLFKALSFMHRRNPQRNHNLLGLWTALPEHIREELDNRYARCCNLPVEQVLVAYTDSPHPPKGLMKQTKNKINDAETLQDWLRYFEHHVWKDKKYQGMRDAGERRIYVTMGRFINTVTLAVFEIRQEWKEPIVLPNPPFWVGAPPLPPNNNKGTSH